MFVPLLLVDFPRRTESFMLVTFFIFNENKYVKLRHLIALREKDVEAYFHLNIIRHRIDLIVCKKARATKCALHLSYPT